MSLITRFDLSSDMTSFFLFMFVLMMIFAVLLARVTPGKKRNRGGGSKVNDRFSSRNGELID